MVSKEIKTRAKLSWIALFLLLEACGARQYVREFSLTGAEPTAEFLSEEQVTAGNEANYAPELSPNGEFVLFVSEKSGNKDIWEKRAVGGFVKQLTSHPADDFSPSMSPDGKHLVFVTRRGDAAGNIVVTSSAPSRFGFGSKNLDETLSEIALPESEEMSPSWYPNSEKVIFSSRIPGEKLPRIMSADIKSLLPKPVFDWHGQSPVASPTDDQIAFSREGALFLGDVNGRVTQLTLGGPVKDGQPRFSRDGKSVVFVRYSDDSNGDGQIDGKDFGSIWRVSTEVREGVPLAIRDLAAEPLTESGRPHYFPEERLPFIYFTMQNKGNLDVYRLPKEGPIRIGATLTELSGQFEKERTYSRKLFLLRKGRSLFCRAAVTAECGEVMLRELRWLVQERRAFEAQLVAQSLKDSQPPESTLSVLAELALIDLVAQRFSLFEQKLEPSKDDKLQLQSHLKNINRLVALTHQNGERVLGQALLLEAKIFAALRNFGEADARLGELQAKFKGKSWLSAEAALLAARLVPYFGDKSRAAESLRLVIVAYPDQDETIKQAAKAAVKAVEGEGVGRLEPLASLRDRSKGLKFLSSEAHMAIAEEYERSGKLAVARNEYRQIVKLYDKEGELQLAVAERLAQDLEKNSQASEAEGILLDLFESKSLASKTIRAKALKLLEDHWVRRGENMIREKEPGQAIKLYRRVLELDPSQVPANRGLVDAAFLRKGLDEVIADLEVKAHDPAADAKTIYAYGYALSYRIDETKDFGEKLQWIEKCTALIERARELDGQILQIHQTLGWLYVQKDLYLKKQLQKVDFVSSATRRFGIVKEFFGVETPNYLEMAADAYLLAYSLTDDGSVDRANLDLNLGNTYFELHNYPKALEYFSRRIRMLASIPLRDLKGEALLFRNAGRSAFYSDELAYGEVLQRRALTAWQKAGSDRDVAYSLDALALTLREEKKHKEALSTYLRLQKVQMALGDLGNASQTKVNYAYTLYLDGQYESALVAFRDAEAALVLSRGGVPKEETREGLDAIKVDVAGQDSAAKGLDEFLIRDLIATTRYQIYLKAGYPNEADVQLERKLALLSEPSTLGGSGGKSRVEERAITLNRKAHQLLRDGRLRQAAEFFRESAVLAGSLCTDRKLHCKDYALNILSMYRVHVLRARMSLIDNVEKDLLVASMGDPVNEAQERAVKGSRLDVLMVRKLRGLRLSLRCTITEAAVQGRTSATGPFSSECSNSGDGALDLDFLTKELQKTDLAQDERNRIEALIGKVSSSSEAATAKTWGDLVYKGLAHEALEALWREMRGKPRGLTLYERVIALKMAREAAMEPRSAADVYRSLSYYDDIRLLDVGTRVGLSAEALALLLKDLPDHAAPDGTKIYVLQVSDTEVLLTDGAKPFIGKNSDLSLALSQATERWFGGSRSGLSNERNLYVIPLDSTAGLGVGSLVGSKSGNQTAEVPSARLVAGFEKRSRIAKASLRAIGFPIQESKFDLVAKRVTVSKQLEFGRVSSKGSDLIVVDSPIFLNDSDVAASRLGKVENLARSDFENISFLSLGSLSLGNSTSIFFSNVQQEDPAKSGLSEGWVGLSVLLYQSGLPTAIVACDSEHMRDELRLTRYLDVSPSELGVLERLDKGSGGCSVKVLGNPGINSKKELAYAKASLEARMVTANDAVDNEEWAKATLLWREAAFFAGKAGRGAELEESEQQGVQAAIKARAYPDALFFQQGIIARKLVEGDQEQILKSKIEYAKISVKAEQFELADSFFNEAIVARKQQRNFEEVGKLYQYLAVSAQGQRKYAEAASFFNLSHDAFRQAGQVEVAAGKLADAANIQKDALGDKTKALELYQAAEDELKQSKGFEARWSIAVDRANTLNDLGRTNEAIAIFESLDKEVPKEMLRLRVRALQGLSNAYFRGGMFQKASISNGRTADLVKIMTEPEPRVVAEIDVLNLKAYLQAKLGDTVEAFKTFAVALDLAKTFKIPGKQAILLNNIGFWQRETGLIESSVIAFNDALSIDKALKSKSGAAFDLRNLAMSQILLGQLDLAKENLAEALSLSREAKIVYNEAYCLFAQGDLALRQGDLKQAEEHLAAATSIAESAALQDFHWRGLAALASVKVLQKQDQAASDYFAKSVGIIEGLRAGLQSQSFRSGFQSDRGVQSVYQSFVSLLMKQGKVAEAWEMSEKSRARAFIDSLGSQSTVLGDEKSQKILTRVEQLKATIQGMSASGVFKESRTNSGQVTEKLRGLRNELEALQSSEEFKTSAAAQVSFSNVISIAEVSQILGSGVSLIEYMVTDQELYAWVIRDGLINGKTIPIKGEDLRRLVDQNRELTQNFSSLDYNGKELAKYLLEPIASLLGSSKGLVIVPHGVLHYLSLAALPLDGEYVIDKYTLGYLESASLARFIGNKSKEDLSKANIIAFGNPSVGKEFDLPFAEREVDSIGRYFPAAKIYTGKLATKQTLLSQGTQGDILHIASHGEFDEHSPGDSRLRLVGTKDRTGDVTVQEVLSLKMQAGLVALSACETGLGKISSGDEIVGLNRAFFLAGAHSIISSLWRISDVASAVAMKRFYRNLSEGDSISLSMRKAQLLVRKYYPHPAYWAAYRVLGAGI